MLGLQSDAAYDCDARRGEAPSDHAQLVLDFG